MKRIASILTFSIIFSLLSPILPYISEEKVYNYTSESTSLPLQSTEIFAKSASTSPLKQIVAGYSYSGTVSFTETKGSFSIELPLSNTLNSVNPEDIKVIWKNASGEKLVRTFDESETRDIRPSIWSEDAVFAPTKSISYEIISPVKLTETPKLRAVDVRSYTTKLTVDTSSGKASASDASVSGFSIVSRSAWGANESIRYQDSSTWKNYYANLEKTKNDPLTDAQVTAKQHQADLEFYLASKYPDMYTSVQTIDEENGHKLVWSIEKTAKVEKIVLHHTAENNIKDLSDEELIRSTYYYHAVSRGWGDIGYNYIVGQRGQVYEGRAGGDYVVWAHAAWNNKSTVWVSVIGNFENESVNEDQEAGINKVIKYLSTKYGIDLSKTSSSHKECKGNSASTCLFADSETPNLVGHRDVGYTTCPGKNLYALIPDIRKNATYSFGLTSVVNPLTKTATPTASKSKWGDIRVLLSYKDMKSVTIKGVNTAPQLTFGKTGGTLKKNIALTLEANGSTLSLVLGNKRYKVGTEALFSSDILEVTSWNRKPTWDASGTMNDNTFRGKLRVRAVGGKIELVNILPLEDYLKGLAEISNGDPEEKIKTIVVAARSYANFYIQSKNRKFPGKEYDASDDPEVFQKYLGYGYEKRSPRMGSIVEATRGIGISYNGEFIKPWYFSQSDGKTRSYKEYCTSNGGKDCQDIPYLQATDDPAGVGQTRKWHGVGISGIGATYYANQGWKYDAIIAYYLKGTKIQSIY